MRHRISGKKLSLDRDKRKALFKNLINALVIHGEIKTTEARAKVVRRLVEKLINKGKKQTLHARRLIAAFLNNQKAVGKIVDELAPLFKERKGGFVRIIRLKERRGDNAPMVKLELVEKAKKEEKPDKKDEKNKNDKKK